MAADASLFNQNPSFANDTILISGPQTNCAIWMAINATKHIRVEKLISLTDNTFAL
jgi:hypothetical protein